MKTLNEALGDARSKRIAIGHFNVSDLVALKAVTDFIGVREIVAAVAGERLRLFNAG